MKLQNLAIIFLVLVIPIILLLAYYLQLQQDTLKMQAEYDTKLVEATKEGIKAFEVNTVEWTNSKTGVSKNDTITATINTFINSLANNLNISGTSKEYMANYIPAITLTMYDSYYIYAQSNLPITIENSEGVQLYYNESEDELTTNSKSGVELLPIYKPKDGATWNEKIYKKTDKSGNVLEETNIKFVTNLEDAETEYKHTLSNPIAYSAKYSKTDTNVVVNYTLDNRIYVYGTINGEYITEDGYLVWFDENTKLPQMRKSESSSNIIVVNGIKNSRYKDTTIGSEVLEEQIVYKESGTKHLKTFKYIYDINDEKLYYDEESDNFFTIAAEGGEREFLIESKIVTAEGNAEKFYEEGIKVGDSECKYKSVSVLWGNGVTEYKKIYQVLNGEDKGKWYTNLKEDSGGVTGIEGIDTPIESSTLEELGLDDLRFATIYRDFSAINYYVEAYAFTNWIGQNLNGVKQEIYNETTGKYEATTIEVEEKKVDIFKITEENDLEKETSPIAIHKKNIMREHINSNLSLVISNYSQGIYQYRMPKLTEEDWEKIFSNISMVTFFQGVPIGLKYYNNYAIATSTTNLEYVDPEELYFTGEDTNYHRVYCEKCGNVIYTGYRSAEYVLKEYKNDSESIYYYKHDKYSKETNKNSEIACYSCIVNKDNYKATTDTDIAYTQAKAYNEALARERYYQKERLTAKIMDDGITISVSKRKLSIDNTDIIFILDDSDSMYDYYSTVEDTCCELLDTILSKGASSNFFIGFIRFSSNAKEIGTITDKSQLEEMKQKIIEIYGKNRGGSTKYTNAFNMTSKMIENYLDKRENKRAIIFMTDGNPRDNETSILTSFQSLKDNGKVDMFYAIKYETKTKIEILRELAQIFEPNSAVLDANSENVLETFKNIMYSINASAPVSVTTENGRLDVSDLTASEEQPAVITIKSKSTGARIKEITITNPLVSNDLIIIEGDKMYLSIDQIVKECGLASAKDLDITIEYYVEE